MTGSSCGFKTGLYALMVLVAVAFFVIPVMAASGEPGEEDPEVCRWSLEHRPDGEEDPASGAGWDGRDPLSGISPAAPGPRPLPEADLPPEGDAAGDGCPAR